jgi:hypothetical protein
MGTRAEVDGLVKDFVNFEGVRERATKRKKVDVKVSVNDLGLTVQLNNLKQFKAVSTDSPPDKTTRRITNGFTAGGSKKNQRAK